MTHYEKETHCESHSRIKNPDIWEMFRSRLPRSEIMVKVHLKLKPSADVSWVMSIRYFPPVTTTVNINAKRLFLQCCFGRMNWYRIYCTWRTASENLKRSMKLTLNSLLLMNDNTTKSLYSGLQDYRGRLQRIAPVESYCKQPLIR